LTTLNVGTGGTGGSLTGNITNGGIVTFNRSDASTYAGLISSNGLVNKLGLGTLELTNANTYTGGTSISGGTLLANNATGSATGTGAVTVNGGATLGGTGAVSGSVTVNGAASGAPGTLSPGTSIESLGTGSLTFNGAASGGSGAILKFEIGPAGTADLVNAAIAPLTNLTIDGTSAVGPTLALVDLGAGAIADGTKYTVISYNGTWNGKSFANAPNFGIVMMGAQQFRIRYADSNPGGNFATETASNIGVGKFVTLTAVPELGSFLTMGLIGCCVLGAVRLGKRYGFKALSL
jgi:fibronectin-binding autotransporter adhesin